MVASHRVGHLNIGGLAVWIGVTSKHRDAALKASRFLIDEIKLRLPVWKKEHYLDGETTWVNCQGCYHHTQVSFCKSEFYEKQICHSEIQNKGQDQLANAKVLVVGAGGLGCPALSYLAGAGVGQISICDGDRLEVTNLHRQTLYSHYDIGDYKAQLAKKRLTDLNPFINIKAVSYTHLTLPTKA